MSLMQSPEATILLHRSMAREEHERNRHPRFTDLSRPWRQAGLRTAIGHMLIAAGSRLNPPAGAQPAVFVFKG